MITRLHILFIVVASALFGFGFIFVSYVTQDTERAFASSEEEVSYWGQRIRMNSPESAYATFKTRYSDSTPDTKHDKAHIFGRALYQEVPNASGVIVCDSAFTSGCFHEFIGSLVTEHGFDILHDLKTACGSNTGCNHGIGHGIVGYSGYRHEDLLTALELCRTVYTDATHWGCYGGAFMEYNTRTLAQSNTSARVVTPDDPYTPCTSLATSYQFACFAWQPQLWAITFLSQQKGADLIESTIDICAKLSRNDHREACLWGIGQNMWTEVAWNTDDMIRTCRHATNELDAQSCITGAAYSYYRTTHEEKEALDMCASLPHTEGQEACSAQLYRNDIYSQS